MEYPNQTLRGGSLQVRTKSNDLVPQASSIPLSSSEGSPQGLQAPLRRSSLPNTRSNRTPPSNINTSQPKTRGTKSSSAGPREKASHGTLMNNMSASMAAANEITYTPTTHRISKAKKGKKVHACEFPGCTKVISSGLRCGEKLTLPRYSPEQSIESRRSIVVFL